ncbi:hypothetical protein E2C01_044312 [Portunus trituberculatus]|uniref:Uncharacterized protein n=1 Tax=Portunus trituberculatus TaxID=210409 RepID=A0A5B7FZN1_PORTR|nr:hypothetical protein [Portunus trituberculatus]
MKNRSGSQTSAADKKEDKNLASFGGYTTRGGKKRRWERKEPENEDGEGTRGCECWKRRRKTQEKDGKRQEEKEMKEKTMKREKITGKRKKDE